MILADGAAQAHVIAAVAVAATGRPPTDPVSVPALVEADLDRRARAGGSSSADVYDRHEQRRAVGVSPSNARSTIIDPPATLAVTVVPPARHGYANDALASRST